MEIDVIWKRSNQLPFGFHPKAKLQQMRCPPRPKVYLPTPSKALLIPFIK